MAQQRAKGGCIVSRRQEDGYHHGRPPLGFETDYGHLVPAEDYDQVASTFDLVEQGNFSKTVATTERVTSQFTIGLALDCPGIFEKYTRLSSSTILPLATNVFINI